MWETVKDIGYWLKESISPVMVKRAVYGLIILLLLYYPVGMYIVHNVDDNPDFGPQNTEGDSHAVAVSIALIDREIEQNSWVANDPFFKPGAALDNMAHYQVGIISSVARFSIELRDQLGRTRGSSNADTDLTDASGALQYGGDIWWWNPSVSYMPMATSEQQYIKAMESLKVYNIRLSRGMAIFDKRSDNLLSTLDKIALDLGASSDSIEIHAAEGFGCVFDTNADDLFYNVKGQAYAYRLILQGLRKDFEEVIVNRDVEPIWDKMETSFDAIIAMDPLIVSNCETDGLIFQNHLTSQGFHLLRARTQLKEITNILLK